jgi:Alg9-like mannosyltransferase family
VRASNIEVKTRRNHVKDSCAEAWQLGNASSPASTWPPYDQLVYRALVLLRAAVALTGLAYIHPDEWHQSGEYLAHKRLGIGSTLPWEFDPRFPCRSAASLSLFNLPFMIFASLCRQYQYGKGQLSFPWQAASDVPVFRPLCKGARSGPARYLPRTYSIAR